jgi:hypothetical protein
VIHVGFGLGLIKHEMKDGTDNQPVEKHGDPQPGQSRTPAMRLDKWVREREEQGDHRSQISEWFCSFVIFQPLL